MKSQNKRDTYKVRVQQFSDELRKQSKNLTRISIFRLVFFIAFLISLFILIPKSILLTIIISTSIFGGFIVLVKMYFKTSKRKDFLEKLIQLNNAELSLLNGDLSVFESGKEFINPKHPYTSDLDIFGDNSLFQYLNRTISPNGKELLASWVANIHKDKAEIEKKQEAIKELAEKLEWRQNFYASAMDTTESKEEIEKLLLWSQTPMILKKSKIFKYLSYFFPAIALVVFLFSMTNQIPFSALGIAIVLNLLLLSGVIRKINDFFSLISKKVQILRKYSTLVQLIENEDFESEYLNDLKKGLETKGKNASKRIQQLHKLLAMFEYRLNMLMGMILNASVVWDIHIVFAIEKWRKKNQHLLLNWLKVIDEFEALNSFATYSYNNDGFVFPEISEKKFIFHAENLGHPLLGENVRINNNLHIDELHQYFVVTGGNMAGKSTFLRTVGVNLVLGMNGAPVCATRFSFKPIEIYSSMRTNDSLAHSESYFFAEISKLKSVLDQLKNRKEVFVLLDEILKGTNSTDQQQGSIAFLNQLKKYTGAGLIATHDLSLGKLAKEYPQNFQNKCFEVSVEDDKLIFDYKLVDGIAQNLNASFLMKQMGIMME
jgi:DNA mismatch repair ATPase MutS